MTKKTDKILGTIKKILPYFITGAITLGIVSVGSIDKNTSDVALSLSTFAANDYSDVSTDQISELYLVADLSSALGLASAADVASNYVITTSMYETGQTTSGKLEKNPLVDTSSLSRGVITYTVSDGDSMESIANKYGLSTDQIRWSNGLKTTSISEGDTLYLPSVSGIVYTVKSSDTIESISEKYGSTVAEIIALNDLEISGISEGMRIIIKGGTLPETERPEYVAPKKITYYTYTYYGNTASRINIVRVSEPDYDWSYGNQCVSYVRWWRNTKSESPGPIPNWGNANRWYYGALNAGYQVDKNPTPGSIFQTSSGWYGHVGIVLEVYDDGSLLVREMNYNYRAGVITEGVIPANAVNSFWYIH